MLSRKQFSYLTVLIGTLLIGISIGLLWGRSTESGQVEPTPQKEMNYYLPSSNPTSEPASTSSAPGFFLLQETLIEVSKKVAPAVVNITTITGLGGDFFFNILPQQGQGSGVIFNEKGYILTNEHVVHEAREIKVLLMDGREFKGKLVGSDLWLDLAIIKIAGQNLPVARLGDSNKIRVGEFCVAIGNPFGLQNTVTFGVISALDRSIRVGVQKVMEGLIQTDTAINPGNSGGPLINFQGEVIGINTAIIPYAQGIGFAIPINSAKDILHQLITYGKVRRPWLGISYLPVSPRVTSQFNLETNSGIYVISVIAGGPASRAGLKEGDVILKINHTEVTTSQQLKQAISQQKIGEKVKLSILRRKEVLFIVVTLGKIPER